MELTARDPAPGAEGWSKIIQPERPWFDLQLGELWRYRDLIYLFARRDLVSVYKQTLLGPLWFFAQPVFTAAVFWMVFGRIGGIITTGTPQLLFFMAGIILWNYFSNCLLRTATTLTANATLFGKVYFPRLAVPLSVVLSQLVSFAVQLALFVALFGLSWAFGVPVEPNWRMISLPLLLLNIVALALGVGCIVAALTTRYRDLEVAVGFGVQLWMYGSCVVYPLEAIPKDMRWYFLLNPMVPIIESFRFAFLGRGVVEVWHLALSMGVSMVCLVVGLMLFRHVEGTFLDTV
jgi:lipopolysaccharide transport system permease protein